jgi:hypothetical protein
VALLGTNLVFTPEVSGACSIPPFHLLPILLVGFFSEPNRSRSSPEPLRDN